MDNRNSKPTLPAWLGCPVCQSALDRTETGLYCPTDSLDFPLQDGIFRLLPPGEREAAAAYGQQYRIQREAQGWRPLVAEELTALPEKSPAGWDPLYWPTRRQSFEALKDWMETFQRPGTGMSRVVDMGAGFGWLAGRLAGRDFEVVALELSDDDAFGLGAAAGTAGAGGRQPTLVQGDMERPPLRAREVDLLIFNASLHYAIDLKKCLKTAADLLRPGGALVIMDTPVLVGEFTAVSPAKGQPQRKGRQVPLTELEDVLNGVGLDFESRPVRRGWRWSLRQWRIRFMGGAGFSLPLIIARPAESRAPTLLS